jgi:alpha,alpha-trehalase
MESDHDSSTSVLRPQQSKPAGPMATIRLPLADPAPLGNPEQTQLLGHLERLCQIVIKPASGFIKYPFCIPGGYYEQQWDWDGYFIACHLAARTPPQPQYLKYWTLNVLSSGLPDGDVSSCVDPLGPRTGHPSLRLKPFLAQGAELGARLLDDYDWIAEHYEEIVRMATRRESTHFIAAYGLFVWEDAMESGADNNLAIGREPSAVKAVAACDANTFYYREYLALARLAERLGKEEDQIQFTTKAVRLHQAIHTHLWDAEEESFWNLHVVTGEWRKRISYSNFVPLWSGMVTPERAKAMIRRYLWNDEHMLTPHGLRSLSRQDPEYNNENTIIPYSNWQGPVWPIANYFYFVGLMKYGFQEEAAELVKRLIRVYLRDIEFCGSLHENYCAETGASLAPTAEQSKTGQEGGFVGWNLLLQDMIEMLNGHPHVLSLHP